MRWFLRVGAALLLTLGLAATTFAATPDGTTASTAIPLPASLSASGVLTGSSPGSFTYYAFNYPGDGVTGTVALTVSPSDPNTTNAVGVHLYQGTNTLLSMNALGAVSGSKLGTFASPTTGPVLVQVYNYLPGQAASYNFAITGLNGQPGTTTPSTGAPATGSNGKTAATAIPLPSSLSASGTLQGTSEGSFVFYTFNHPGGSSPSAIALTVSPSDSNTTNAVGVNLYQNGVNLLSMNALGAAVSGSKVGSFSPTTAGPILIQVYNYLPGQAASYNFSITGVTQPATTGTTSASGSTAASTGKTATTARPLPANLSASGTIVGSTNGDFTYYTFNYPGNGVTGTVALTVSPSDSNTTNAVGVHLYQGTNTLLSMNALGAVSGSKLGTFASPTAGPVLVQVYNYLPGQAASYNFAITGLTQ
ncbi:MAG TPA: hypothetical protein VNL16_05960 [Chloroflexota bacterium]|nr:hypothetical protein [Chloroflexota bacterium]